MFYLETTRLILRNYKPNDIDDYYAYMRLDYTASQEGFEPFTYQ